MPNPLWLNADTTTQEPAYDALTIRQGMSVMFFGGGDALTTRSGFRPGPGKDPELQGIWPTVSDDMATITISPGSCVIQGTTTALQGAYMTMLADPLELSVPAASDANGRLDRIVITIYDDDVDGSGKREAEVTYLQGTPDAQPVVPGEPDNSITVGIVSVPAGGERVTVDTSTRPYTVASGGILPVRNEAERDALPSVHYGAAVYRLDQKAMEVFGPDGWQCAVPPRPVRTDQTRVIYPNKAGKWVDFTAAEWPRPTFTAPSSGVVIITISAFVQNTNTLQSTCWCGWRLTGARADIVGPSAETSVITAGGRVNASRRRILRYLTPGAKGTIVPMWNVSSFGGKGTTWIQSGDITVEFV